MRQTFELIIFDCDGTLITSEVLNNTAVSKALAHLGYSKYNLDFCLNSFTGKSFKDICKVVEQNENCKIDKNLFGKLISRFSIENIPQIQAAPNAAKLLDQIKIPKVVGSNGHREFVLKYLEQAKLLKFFGASNIFTHNQVDRPKPYPDLFLYAAQMNDVDPKNTMVIEDSVTGVIAAKSAGMYAVGFIGSHINQDVARAQLEDAGADKIIDDLLDVLDLV